MKNKITTVFAMLWLLAAVPAHAVDGVSVDVGNGNSTDMWRVGAEWNWNKKWLESDNWYMGGYWDAQVGEWHGHAFIGGNRNITDFGITPVFRFQQKTLSPISPYFELAIGFHLLSETRINADRDFGSAFQFGDHAGAGFRFGPKGAMDLEYRFQHLSNGSIREPNQGINFNQIRFQYHF